MKTHTKLQRNSNVNPIKLNTLKKASEGVQPSSTPSKKRKRTKITDEMIRQMVELQREGYNQSEVAELLGISQGAVNRNLKKYKPMKTHLTDEERAHMIQLKLSGLNSKQVAIKTHRGLSTVDKVWAEYRKNNNVVVEKIHRVGNELHNVDVHEGSSKLDESKKRVTGEPPVITPPMAENDVPMMVPIPLIHTDKAETTSAVLWLMVTAVAFILGLAVAGL
jgi:predicted transcriptional regulator